MMKMEYARVRTLSSPLGNPVPRGCLCASGGLDQHENVLQFQSRWTRGIRASTLKHAEYVDISAVG